MDEDDEKSDGKSWQLIYWCPSCGKSVYFSGYNSGALRCPHCGRDGLRALEDQNHVRL